MRYIKTYPILFLVIWGLHFQGASGQEDKFTLLTEPFNLRPVSMHRGQFQFNAGYRLAIRNAQFDADGEKIGLKEDGSAVVGHTYFFNLHFGIFEFLEFGAEMNYLKQGVRGQTREYLSGNDILTVTELTEYKGMEDLFLSLTLRLPFLPEMIDLGLTGFYSLALAEHQPDRPGHAFEVVSAASNWNAIRYRYNNRNGNGVSYFGGGGTLKIRGSMFAFQASGSMQAPAGETNSVRWISWLNGTDFEYTSSEYALRPPVNLFVDAGIHIQAAGWLDLFLGGAFDQTTNGWYEALGQKYTLPETSVITLQTGFEIQVSPSLRLLEYAVFPISGKNTYASFAIHTGLSYNFIF